MMHLHDTLGESCLHNSVDCYIAINDPSRFCPTFTKPSERQLMTRRGSFDAEAFYVALDMQRTSKDLTWKQVASDAGVSASTLTRMKQGKRPDVDSMAALATWAGLDLDDYVISEDRGETAPLPKISALLRSDPNLSKESATAIEEMLRATYERLKRERNE